MPLLDFALGQCVKKVRSPLTLKGVVKVVGGGSMLPHDPQIYIFKTIYKHLDFLFLYHYWYMLTGCE